ncbi:hypothetical protein [Nocardia brevicatena]|uniref:hypothetical protein n=1 Tax=Nocardia brevicatena TaxID=37327 RepID=UPI0012F8E9F9|nr:hypothetical protein [Nocardia brevicatena]
MPAQDRVAVDRGGDIGCGEAAGNAFPVDLPHVRARHPPSPHFDVVVGAESLQEGADHLGAGDFPTADDVERRRSPAFGAGPHLFPVDIGHREQGFHVPGAVQWHGHGAVAADIFVVVAFRHRPRPVDRTTVA